MARTGTWRTGICKAVSHTPLTATPSKAGDKSYRSMPTANDSRGFTLIELLVVILILSITISFIVPRIIGKEEIALRSAARKLLYAAKKRSDDAVFRKEKKALNIDIDKRGYGARDGRDWLELPYNVAVEEVVLGRQRIRSGTVTITFFPSGLRDEATIRLSDTKGTRKYVIYIPALGERFEIHEE